MLKRTLSALVGAPLLLVLTYLGGVYTAFLVFLLSLLALLEFLKIGRKMGIEPWYKLNLLAALIWFFILFQGQQELLMPFLILWLLISFGRFGLQYGNVELYEAGYNFFAFFYTVVLLSHLYLMRNLEQGITWTFMTFFLVWGADTGAYLIGRTFGRHLLAPLTSPKKTWEGAFGGLLSSLIIGVALWRGFGGLSLGTYCGIAIAAGICAQIGDLFESALKRSAKVKDSGNLIPGHGGILDRFDSFIFVLPLVYYIIVNFSFGS